MKISIFTPQVISEVGGRQSEFHIYPKKDKIGADTKLFMVCDGIGGKEKGAIASQLASHSFAQYFEKHPPILIDSTYIQKALDFTENQFDEYLSIKSEEKGMGTTLGLLFFNEQGAVWTGVGDSRLYHFRDGALIAVLDGQIDNQESNKVSPLNAIQGKAVGAAKPVVQIIDEIEVRDYFLLCTLGVLENLSEEHLIEIIASEESDDFKRQQLGVHISKRPAVNSSSFLIKIKAIEPEEVLPTLAERAAQTAKVAAVRTVAPVTEKAIEEKEVVNMEVEPEKIVAENKIDDDVIPGLDKGEKLETEQVKVTERVEAVRQKEGGSAEAFKRILYASLIIMGIVFSAQWVSGLFSKNKLKNTDTIAQTDDLSIEKNSNKTNTTTPNKSIEQNTNKSPTDNRNINSNPAAKESIPTESNQETVTIIDGASVRVPKKDNAPPSDINGQEAVNNINQQSVNRAQNEEAINNNSATSKTTNAKPVGSSNNVKKTIGLTQQQSAQLKKQGLVRYGVLSEGLMAVSKNGKKGFVDKNSKLVILCQYDDVQAFNAGFAGVKYKGRWTFINKNGYFITKNPTYQFLNVLPFSSSKLAPVQVNFEGVENKWGYITTNGQRAIPYRFDKAGVFKGGKANVLIGNKSFMINEKGDCLGNCPDNY